MRGRRHTTTPWQADDWKGRRHALFRVFKKVWMPLLLVVVVALGAYAVVRIRDTIGAHEPASDRKSVV